MNEFIRQQRESAASESDPAVRYGMERVITALEKRGDAGGSKGVWVSVAEAAKRMNVDKRTIHTWKQGGNIPHKQPGGRGGKLLIYVPD